MDTDYRQELWGEVIRGTREQLQALGLGRGEAFPSNPRARKPLKVTDPRGFPCAIWPRGRDEPMRYMALINFPGREPVTPHSDPLTYAPGVTVEHYWWADHFEGVPRALVDAGLVRFDQLPGAPAMGKTVVRIAPDGSIAPRSGMDEPAGTRTIRRRNSAVYSVSIAVDDAERERRHAESIAGLAAWEARMRALPRPAPLVTQQREEEAQTRRAALRLVWSRPRWVPGLISGH